MDAKELLRKLPAVGKVLEDPDLAGMVLKYGKELFKSQLVWHLERCRKQIISGDAVDFDYSSFISGICLSVESIADVQRRKVINATGILLHTGLGRAPLAAEAQEAVMAAGGYTPVQSDPVTGKRSLRELKVESMLRELTGAQAVTVVNNNAAATMLVLNTMATGRQVVISRGQLVEIGGAFRMPDVMRMSGAEMHEIGTTNRTHLRDYREAFNQEVAAFMHVHTSNYRLRGFGGTPGIQEIAKLARELGVCVLDDLGSGALVPLSRWGVEDEPLVRDSIAADVDLCCFSGDKLIGGAQSGIICGKSEWIERVRKNPFARMFRVDKLTLAALETTLKIWVNGEYAEKIPLYKMLSTPKAYLQQQAELLCAQLADRVRVNLEVCASEAYIGSGSLPDSGVESWAVVADPKNLDPENLSQELRKAGVFARVNGGKVWLDMIAVADTEFQLLSSRLLQVLQL